MATYFTESTVAEPLEALCKAQGREIPMMKALWDTPATEKRIAFYNAWGGDVAAHTIDDPSDIDMALQFDPNPRFYIVPRELIP